MELLQRTGGRPTLLSLNYLLPLRIIKQVAIMFFSINLAFDACLRADARDRLESFRATDC
jgi:hypothetical protein